MIYKLEEIEKRKRVFKDDIQDIIDEIDADSPAIGFINKWINSDDKKLVATATKLLDEIGDIKPQLCIPFTDRLFELIRSNHNRHIWGALTVLESYAELIPEQIFDRLDLIIKAMEKSSIVAKDHAVKIYQKLAKNKNYYETVITLMLEQVRICAPNQLGQYAERTFDVLQKENKNELIEAMRLRIAGLENHHHVRRAEKIIEEAQKI